jgi:DNA invertase Pin-like site-specific DNA recombinase
MLYIPYYRVSTKRQGVSGLGLAGQKEIINNFIQSKGGEILKEFTEVEKGRKRSRVELQKALKLSKDNKAILIVAKLDRLARDAEFSFMVLNQAHEIVCCDFPDGNKMSFGIMAVLAEYETKLKSDRNKSAWNALKAKGYIHHPFAKLGKEVMNASLVKARAESAKVRRKNMAVRDRKARAMAMALKDKYDLQGIADRLNELGYRTPRNKMHVKESVRRLIKYSKLDEKVTA